MSAAPPQTIAPVDAARPARGTGPAARPAAWREIAIGLAVFGCYVLVAHAGGPARRAAASRHATDILDLERRAHIDIEGALNRLLAGHDVLRVLANYEYAFTYIVSAFLLLGWLYARRPEVYRWARTSFVVLNLVGIASFLLYPVMPPRLLPRDGFLDTVTRGHTFGSWGSGAVDHANSLAAMPSLHLAWALWVSVVLGFIAGSLRVQGVSLVHVLVTLFVIMATANHFLLDAAGGAVAVAIAIPIATLLSPRPDRPRLPRLAPADAFFLHVESPAAPQVVGGYLLMKRPGGEPTDSPRPSQVELRDLVADRLDQLPRFRQRLAGGSRWRRPGWVDVDELDWDWHVQTHRLAADEPDERRALDAFVADVQTRGLPRDRPLWRLLAMHGPTMSAVAIVIHHAIADGLGTVQQALRLLEPPIELPAPPRGPGRLQRVAATTAGLARLATDGRPRWRAAGCGSADRVFASLDLDFDLVRETARSHRVRVTDVLLAMTAGGVARSAARIPPHAELRVSSTLMVPRPAGSHGNATAAVIVGLPLDAPSERQRLIEIASRPQRLDEGSRALASRFVMDKVGGMLPPMAHRWFARTVYGPRFFHGIVSNLPGPHVQLSIAGVPLTAVFPIMPLADSAPLAVGALTINGRLGVGISAHPAFVPDAARLETAMREVLDELSKGGDREPNPRFESSSGDNGESVGRRAREVR